MAITAVDVHLIWLKTPWSRKHQGGQQGFRNRTQWMHLPACQIAPKERLQVFHHSRNILNIYPLVNIQKAIENGHL